LETTRIICKNCGAPITTEICPYCNTFTEMPTNMANADYPVIECKSATLNFWKAGFPLIFGLAFLMGVIPFFSIGKNEIFSDFAIIMFLSSIPFLLIGIVSLIIEWVFVSRYLKVRTYGKDTMATVYGYMQGGLYINGVPTYQVKLLVDTDDGPKFILYNLMKTIKPYGVNTTINIKMYKNLFLIME